MESGNLDLIITLVSIIGTVLAAFGFLHREMRRGFERVDQKFDRIDKKFEAKFDRVDEKFEVLRTAVAGLDVKVARIEGHLGIGFPSADEPLEPSERPDCAA